MTRQVPHHILERSQCRLLEDGYGWIGYSLFRSSAVSSGRDAMFARWLESPWWNLHTGTDGDTEWHGPWRIAEFGSSLFNEVSPVGVTEALVQWLDDGSMGDAEGREADLQRLAEDLGEWLALCDPDAMSMVRMDADTCQETDVVGIGDMSGFLEIFALLRDGTGCVVITATDDA